MADDALPWDQFSNSHLLSIDSPHPAMIIGAGLAGSWLARTLAELGQRVVILDAGAEAATGTSSNPAGIAKPFVTRNPCFAMNFYVQAHNVLLQRLKQWRLKAASCYQETGVVQLVEKPYPVSAHYDTLEPQDMRRVSGIDIESFAILFKRAGWLNPKKLCRALLDHPLIEKHYAFDVAAIHRMPDCWQVTGAHCETLLTSHLVVASGASLKQLALTADLEMTPARGQISRFAFKPETPESFNPWALKRVVSGKHYIIPDASSVIIGASFDRDDDDNSIREKDNAFNRTGLENIVPGACVCDVAMEAFAGVRATTPDRLPLVGPIPDSSGCAEVYSDLRHGRELSHYPALPVIEGAFVLGGLGSRGIVTAPLAAELLADFITGGKQINPWTPLINPARFHIRRLKRA